MINTYPYQELGHENHGWLDARHHFSFANYHNPDRMGFGALRVINDDTIKAGAGFDTHPHKNMEIITYVRQGAITHKDSQGNSERISAGNVQVMSAGSGIFHSEFNIESEDTKLFQIWIKPNERETQPSYNSHQFPLEITKNKLQLLVAGDGNAPLTIKQDAFIYAGFLEAGQTLSQSIKHQAYLLVSEGKLEVNDHPVNTGDGLEITDLEDIEIHATDQSKFLVIDVPNH